MIAFTGWLVAQLAVWENLGQRFSGEHRYLQPEDVLGVALFLGGFGLAFYLLWRAQKWSEAPKQKHSPRRLAGELAAAHGLNRRQRRVCREVADEVGLAETAELYVRPEHRGAVAGRDPQLAEDLYGPQDAASFTG